MRLAALLLAALPAGNAPADFAYGIPLRADPGAALHEFALPASVHEAATTPDLADLRVFNGAGEAVQHAFRPVALAAAHVSEPAPLPVFPVHGDPASIGGMRLSVRQGESGTTVEVSESKPAGAAPLAAYLIDASSLDRGIEALRVKWSAPVAFNGEVSIDASDDLARWTRLAAGAPLLRLTHGGHELTRDRVELRGAKSKYLRLTWPPAQPALEGVEVSAEPAAMAQPTARDWREARGRAVGAEFVYDLGGRFPYDRVAVRPEQANTVARVTIETGASETGPWRAAASAVIYRLVDRGVETASPDIAVYAGADRFLRLRAERAGELGTAAPLVKIGWIPRRVVFAARGAGPFQAAFGAVGVKASAIRIESLIPGFGTDAALRPAEAATGDRITLGGEAKRTPVRSYRAPLLWAALVAAAGMLSWMAWRLVKQSANPA